MDRITHEVLKKVKIPYEIISLSQLPELGQYVEIDFVERWDEWMKKAFTASPALPASSPEIKFFKQKVERVREFFFSRYSISPSMSKKILLIRRSESPEYYKPGGQAEASGYGIDRRNLTGLEIVEKLLEENGLPAEVYEPGNDTFEGQIRKFYNTEAVIAVKGAELAHLMWMPEGSRLLMVVPATMRRTMPVQRQIAAVLGIEVHEIYPVKKGRTVKLDEEWVLGIFKASSGLKG
jgi:hypothetical protein